MVHPELVNYKSTHINDIMSHLILLTFKKFNLSFISSSLPFKDKKTYFAYINGKSNQIQIIILPIPENNYNKLSYLSPFEACRGKCYFMLDVTVLIL